MPVFSLEEARALQVKNISQQTFKYWSESAVYGYFGGGTEAPGYINTIQRLDFSSEILSLPGKNLPTSLGLQRGVASSLYGYFGGGYFTPVATSYNTISRLDFSNEILSLPGKNLPGTLWGSAVVSSGSYGYFGGGVTGNATSNIRRLDFSSETVTEPGKNLPTARYLLVGVSGNSYGYFGGGFTPPFINTISKLDFQTESVIDTTSVLPFPSFELSGLSNTSYGYFGGGYIPGFPGANICTITRLDFSNETISNPGKNLPAARSRVATTSSNYYGYFGGGSIPGNYVCTITRLDFSTESVNNLTAGFSAIRTNIGSLSGGQSINRGSKTYGYIGGGVSPPPFTYFSEVLSRDFSNDSNATIGSFSTVGLIPGGRWGQATLSSNYYGYFCGGQMPPGWSPGYFNTVTRIDFSNNTVTDPGRNFITDFRYAAGSSSNSYGFIVGGFRGVTMCSIQRMDFSSETFASTGQPNVFFTGSQASVSNNSYGYHVDSGTTYRLDFSTSGLSLPGNNTNLQVRTNIAGFSNNRYGYFGGGYSPTSPGTYTSQMARLDFSTESYSSSTNLPVATSLHAGTSSNTHGYFIAGANPPGVTRTTAVNKLDFGTEIFSPTTAIPSARSELSAMSNSN